MINTNIIKKLEDLGINIDDALVYLLSLYHKLKPSYVPELVKKQVNMTGIIVRDYEKGIVTWTMPLYADKPLPNHLTDKWDWVHSEYRAMFMAVRPSAGGDKRSCTVKMQQFFAENPEVRKQDIIEAAKLYLLPFTQGEQDKTFLQQANYFIFKLTKVEGKSSYESKLSQYIELVHKGKKAVDRYKRNVS